MINDTIYVLVLDIEDPESTDHNPIRESVPVAVSTSYQDLEDLWKNSEIVKDPYTYAEYHKVKDELYSDYKIVLVDVVSSKG